MQAQPFRTPPDFPADICLVTVRREQIKSVLPGLAEAIAIPRVVFLGNHAYCSDNLPAVLGRSRAVLAFPGIAGYSDGGMIRYVDIPGDLQSPRRKMSSQLRPNALPDQSTTWG
jgi:hypothetical protein